MNKIIDVYVEPNTDNSRSPDVHCIFDDLVTFGMIFHMAKSPVPDPQYTTDAQIKTPTRPGLWTTHSGNACANFASTLNLSSYNLLAIDGDLAIWYFYSSVNNHGPHAVTLKVIDDGVITDEEYSGLWSSNAEAVNLWFPEHFVMTITAHDAISGREMRCGALVDAVIPFLRKQGWGAGLVCDVDGYVDVQPLLPGGLPKNKKAKVLKNIFANS
jgi:hypothetical protein